MATQTKFDVFPTITTIKHGYLIVRCVVKNMFAVLALSSFMSLVSFSATAQETPAPAPASAQGAALPDGVKEIQKSDLSHFTKLHSLGSRFFATNGTKIGWATPEEIATYQLRKILRVEFYSQDANSQNVSASVWYAYDEKEPFAYIWGNGDLYNVAFVLENGKLVSGAGKIGIAPVFDQGEVTGAKVAYSHDEKIVAERSFPAEKAVQ